MTKYLPANDTLGIVSYSKPLGVAYFKPIYYIKHPLNINEDVMTFKQFKEKYPSVIGNNVMRRDYGFRI